VAVRGRFNTNRSQGNQRRNAGDKYVWEGINISGGDINISGEDITMSGEDIDISSEDPSGLVAHLGFGCLKEGEDDCKSHSDISATCQEDSDDESEEADGAAEDLDDEDLDEEGGVRCVRESRSGANLRVNMRTTVMIPIVMKPLMEIIMTALKKVTTTCPTQMPQTRLVSPVVRPAPNIA
jgi:hypothetical protein